MASLAGGDGCPGGRRQSFHHLVSYPLTTDTSWDYRTESLRVSLWLGGVRVPADIYPGEKRLDAVTLRGQHPGRRRSVCRLRVDDGSRAVLYVSGPAPLRCSPQIPHPPAIWSRYALRRLANQWHVVYTHEHARSQ